jgi:hypothetical protein
VLDLIIVQTCFPIFSENFNCKLGSLTSQVNFH